jgi:dihydrofolate reductase
MPCLSLVVAIAANGVIGRAGTLPWHLPDDLKRFKAVTLGKPVLMGRRTYESIGKALPGRRNVVLTRASGWTAPNVEVVSSFDAAAELTQEHPEVCVIGGVEVFQMALPLADRIYLTRVQAAVDGDVHFPSYDFSVWRELERIDRAADARHPYDLSFLILQRPTTST